MIVTIPIRTVSEINQHEHWRYRQRRANEQRGLARILCRDAKGLAPPLTITLTRIAPSAGLDDDNCVSACKHARDGIADALGLDDGDKRLTWLYAQERGADYAVRVEI